MALSTYQKKEITEILMIVIFYTVVVGLGSLFVGFGAGGFESKEVFEKNSFYIPYFAVFFIGWISVKILGLFIFGEKDREYEGAIAHDPEQTPIGFLTIFKSKFLIIFGSLIFFMLLGWYFTKYQPQTIFSALPTYQQQFTKGADLFFSVYPASPTETFGALFLISVVDLALGYYMMKGKLSKIGFYFLSIVVGSLFSTGYGIIDHLARYGGSDIALQNVAIFWFVTGLLATVTGSIFPSLILHDVNNFYVKFSKLFGSDIVTFFTFTTIIIMIVVYIFAWYKISNGKSYK